MSHRVSQSGRTLSHMLPRLIAAALAVAALTALPAPAHAEDRRSSLVHRDYMAFGDSITYGIGTSDPATRSYPAQADMRGVGVGSACLTTTCPDGLNVFTWWPRYVDSLAYPPEVAVFMIGTNDYTVSSAKQITTAMRRLAELGRDRGIRVVFGTITPAPTGSFWNVGQSGHAKSTRLAVNDWIRDHAWLRGPEYARATQCPDRDLCPRFVAPEFNDVHMNDAGAAVMADVLLTWVRADR